MTLAIEPQHARLIALLPEFNFPTHAIEPLGRYYSLLLQENARQNLTSVTAPEDFIRRHLLDSLELYRLNWLNTDAVWDWGSGGGFPGIPFQLINQERAPWTLIDSEKLKVDFLKRAIQSLQLHNTAAVSTRIEGRRNPPTIVARAVGPTLRLLRTLEKGSTWNRLILFKGPRWETEWADAHEYASKNQISLMRMHSYSIDSSGIQRHIVELKRVPRGTVIR